jgi:hypothetical protein
MFVFSKHCAMVDGQGNDTPSSKHTVAHQILDSGMAPLAPGISPAKVQSLDEENKVATSIKTEIKWTFAGHLTLPIDYSVKVPATGGHVDINQRAPLGSTTQIGETRSVHLINRDVENSISHSNLEGLNTVPRSDINVDLRNM